MAKLRLLFEGYADAKPQMFVLLGNFTSRPYGAVASDMKAYAGMAAQTAVVRAQCGVVCKEHS